MKIPSPTQTRRPITPLPTSSPTRVERGNGLRRPAALAATADRSIAFLDPAAALSELFKGSLITFGALPVTLEASPSGFGKLLITPGALPPTFEAVPKYFPFAASQ